MQETQIFNYLKDLGCCNACCFRYLGFKSPQYYENPEKYAAIYTQPNPSLTEAPPPPADNSTDDAEPASKRRKWAVCISCIGVLQAETWPECVEKVKEVFERKRYSCDTFACALSAPMSTLLRDKAIILLLADAFNDYSPDTIPTPLKEAWKWAFAGRLATSINKTLDSGAISPLLVTVNMEYADDLEDLEPLKKIAPRLFSSRSEQSKRFTVEFTRRSVSQALDRCTLAAMKNAWEVTPPPISGPVQCVSVNGAHAPIYIGGRYIKLSRELPQTPWVINGERILETSVQEIIFKPLEELYGITSEDAEHRLKFISAGREDVDVRCLGNGRPFAIEISDPTRDPTVEELESLCAAISKDGRVAVRKMKVISKDDLTDLKKGEETKCKTYEALCIKLSHGVDDDPTGPVAVTQKDIDKINAFTNTKDGEEGRINIMQKTPIRVLHRRPLLTRTRKILELKASLVPDHPRLLHIRVRTSAGTYIKEWTHGELGRTRPSLGTPLQAHIDILALDVAAVHLDWL